MEGTSSQSGVISQAVLLDYSSSLDTKCFTHTHTWSRWKIELLTPITSKNIFFNAKDVGRNKFSLLGLRKSTDAVRIS